MFRTRSVRHTTAVKLSALALGLAAAVAVPAMASSAQAAGASTTAAKTVGTHAAGAIPATAVGQQIFNHNSGECLSIWGTGDGAAITQVHCDATDARQLWTFISGGGAYQIRNVASQGCLDLFDDISVDGTMVFTWSCQPAGGVWSQNWTIPYVGGGWYEIHPSNVSRALCLDVDSGNTSDGADIKSWGCHGASNQQWGFR
jgi:hypothetical protein